MHPPHFEAYVSGRKLLWKPEVRTYSRKNPMPRFYFHIRRGDEVTQDPEGSELASAAQARQEAILSAREILSQRVLNGEPIDGDAFEITRADGTIVSTLSFRSVLDLR